jgi:hypothetical protein
MNELLERLLTAIKEVSSVVHCNSDYFNLPTYWHVDNTPFLIRKDKKGVSIENHGGNKNIFPKKTVIREGSTHDDIIKLFTENYLAD